MPLTMGMFARGSQTAGISSLDYVATGSGTTAGVTASFGAADGNRFIIITAGIRVAATMSGVSFSGVTIGGVTGTVYKSYLGINANDTTRIIGIMGAAVPSGTSGNVVFTMSNGNTYGNLDWSSYRLIGSNVQLVSAQVINGATSFGTAPELSACIGVCESESGGTAITWTGLTRDVEKDKGNWRYSSASKYFATSQSLTVNSSGNKIAALFNSP